MVCIPKLLKADENAGKAEVFKSGEEAEGKGEFRVSNIYRVAGIII